MADRQDFEAVAARLAAIEQERVRYPDMPIDVALKEAGIMAAAAEEDCPKLTAVGMDAGKVPALSTAVAALSFAQARYVAAMGEVKAAAGEWAQQEPGALELRSEILAAAAFALRNTPEAVKAVRRIRQAGSRADMIGDLEALAELGSKYEGQLKAVNFDTKLLGTAAETATALRKVYAKAFLEKTTTGAREIRDRAFTHMRSCMAEVLEVATYALRKDPERLVYYHSSYRSRNRRAAQAAAGAHNGEVTAS